MFSSISGVLTVVCLAAALIALVVWTTIRAEDPARLLFKWVISFVVLGLFGTAVLKGVGFSIGGAFIVPFVCVFIALILTALWGPHIGALVAKPITSMFDGGDVELEPQPLYSSAIAKRKQGQFREAIYRVQEQLEKFPHDLTGHLLLAEIQADDLKDLQAAEATIQRFCNQPEQTPQTMAVALNHLADWRLRHGKDVEGAIEILERVVALSPQSESAQSAAQRIAHLGRRTMRFGDPEKLKVAIGVDDVGLLKDSSSLKPREEDPTAVATEYVRHLEQYPRDAEVREKLAMIYAEHYQRIDLAVGQFEELLAQPNQPPKMVGHWLNRIADILSKEGDVAGARAALERLIEAYPASAQASQARQRIEYLGLASRTRPSAEAIRLGTYEQDIGIKQNRPPPPS